jgi:hypothetical protein
VTKADIKNYLDKYMKNQPYVSGLLINPAMKGMVNLDSFYHVTEALNTYALKAAGSDNLMFEGENMKAFQSIAEIIKMNPGKKVRMDVYAEKDRVADTRVVQFMDKLKAMGISADQIEVKKHINKTKKLSENEKPLQNTIHFSF